MQDLADIEAIKQLKYRYFRALDTKRWDDLAATLTDDAETDYDSGRYAFRGRDAILDFLRGALGSRSIVSMHTGHHPEIEVTGATTARGTWYLQDMVIFREAGSILTGAAFYHDEYRKVGGEWKISKTGYERTFEMMEMREFTGRTQFDEA